MKSTKLSLKGFELIKRFEALKLKAYLCPAGIPTISIGCTYYPDGRKVKLTDPVISESYAKELFEAIVVHYEKAVDSFCRDDINQNQFDALVSLAYNIGVGNLQKSTLIKKVNINPNDPTIQTQFLRWNKADQKVLPGLTKRRQAESDLYFLPI
jgi:lysozyme